MISTLKFGSGNSKLASNISTFSLPAGYSCPGANNCKSQCIKTNEGYRIKDGPNCKFRCFAAIDEVLKPTVRELRWHNFNLIKNKTQKKSVELIESSLPKSAWKPIIRLHVAGDFFSQDYFDAWVTVANNLSQTLFYAYTKSIPFWLKRINSIPTNLKLVASLGGKWDNLIEINNLRTAEVVFSESEASELGLELDHDDSHAYEGNTDFALLIHGTQPKGTLANTAWQSLKKIGKAGYSSRRRRSIRGFNYRGGMLSKK